MKSSVFDTSNLCGWISEVMIVLFLYFFIVSRQSARTLEDAMLEWGAGAARERPLAFLEIGERGELALDGEPLELDQALERLATLRKNAPEGHVQLRGRATTDYAWALSLRAALADLEIPVRETLLNVEGSEARRPPGASVERSPGKTSREGGRSQ